jgi:septum formation protein
VSSLILASASPRRREILGWLGVEFDVVVPDVQELTGGLGSEALVLENARLKALAGREAAGREEGVVLGVDTDVFLGEEPLGKPADRAEAEQRLRALSGRTHTVLSGLCLLPADPASAPHRERSGVAESLVTFRQLDDASIGTYLASEEWRDRAGGYAIQGLGSFLIEKVQGDFSNVVGLPLRLLLALAPELGENPKAKD